MRTIDGYLCEVVLKETGVILLMGPGDNSPSNIACNGLNVFSSVNEAKSAQEQLNNRGAFGSTRIRTLNAVIAEDQAEARLLEPPYVVMTEAEGVREFYGPRVAGKIGHDGYAYLENNGWVPFMEYRQAEYNRGEIQRQAWSVAKLLHWELK